MENTPPLSLNLVPEAEIIAEAIKAAAAAHLASFFARQGFSLDRTVEAMTTIREKMG